MARIQVNVTTKVNRASIRKQTHDGREYWIVPSFTLPSNVVMNGILYPEKEIDAHYRGLENTLAPLGHPMVNGEFVSAFSFEGINAAHIGACNRNVKKVGNRIALEKWIDIKFAANSEGGRRVLDRVQALYDDVPGTEPVHTSVAVYLDPKPVTNEVSKGEYNFIASIDAMDHDAILLDEPGAATPEQGVGMMVNADLATTLKGNASVTAGVSYRERENRIRLAAEKRFDTGEGKYVWVADFTDTHVVLQREGGVTEEYAYTDTGGVITIGDTGQPVTRRESWMAMAANSIKQLFNRQAVPPVVNGEDDMSLTPEERAALLKDFGEVVTHQIKPLSDGLATLQANHEALAKKITANQDATEATMRAEVALVHGEIVANGLNAEALADLHKKLKPAAPLAPNSATTTVKGGAPDPTTYEGAI